MVHWKTWQDFQQQQQQIELDDRAIAHLPVRIRYMDVGRDLSRRSQVDPTQVDPTQQATILLMHGIPTWGYLYHSVIPPLVAKGYRVIAPDFLGHGWSDRRDRFDRSFQTQAQMIRVLLQHLNLEKVDVVGHDTGGAVALILAIEHSHLVNRLILTNSVCYDRFDDDMLDFGHPLRWKPQSVNAMVEALQESLAMGLSNPEKLTPAFSEGIIAPWASEEGKLSLIRNASALNANQTMALVDRHGTITAPTQVIWGMDDPWQKSEDGRQLASEIPTATFVPIKNASHWIQQDASETFTYELLSFLGS